MARAASRPRVSIAHLLRGEEEGGGGGTDRRDGDQQRTEPHAARERRQRDEYEEGDAGVRGVEASRLPQREAVRDKQPTRHPHESMEQSDGTRAPR